MWNPTAWADTQVPRGRCDAALSRYLDTLHGVAYVVDDDDVIIAYGRRSWDRAAVLSGAPDLASPAAVLGRNVFDVIADEETRIGYVGISAMLREGVRPSFEFPLRSDGQEDRSLRMFMTLIRYGGGRSGLLYHVLSQEAAGSDRNATSLAQCGDTRVTRPLLRVCSFCQYVHRGCVNCATTWEKADSCSCRIRSQAAALSHGICPECYSRVVRPQLEAYCANSNRAESERLTSSPAGC